jgi:DNA-binding transcriptional regulator YiaG
MRHLATRHGIPLRGEIMSKTLLFGALSIAVFALPLALDKGSESGRVAKGATRSAAVPASANEAAEGTKRRFSATKLTADRAKLGLSAASYGQLVGVSGQTIYHWEQGKARPRAAQLESLASVRKLGAREDAERLTTR